MDNHVRSFGHHMIEAHSDAQNELTNLADDYRDANPPDEMDSEHEQIKLQLQSMSGYKFDSAYIVTQITDHEMTLSLFDSEISNGLNEEVKAYARKYRPHIAEHLATALEIKSELMGANPGRDGK